MIATCPHCEARVAFGSDGMCPACHVSKDAPITAEDVGRVAARQAEAASAPARRRSQNRRDGAGYVLAGVAMIAGSIAMTSVMWTHAADHGGDPIFVFPALTLLGVGMVVRGVIRALSAD